MKKLGDTLKRMLTGLSYQHAADYLPTREKLNHVTESDCKGKKTSSPDTASYRKSVKRRIALIIDSKGKHAPLNYAIDACGRQEAMIDLLIHGAVDMDELISIESQIKESGLESRRIQLGHNPAQSIINYICNHASLIFIVARNDDVVANKLIEEVIPRHGGRMPVPLVLIEPQKNVQPLQKADAA